jgi:uncharacterized membrane protein
MSQIILIFIGAFSRLMPHLPNFTAIAAIALFGATRMQNKKLALITPLAAMLASDVLIGFHSGMWFVYGAFALTSLVGFWVRSSFSYGKLAAGVALSSVLFFLITNFGVWLSGSYGLTADGLATCFAAAIPFFRNQVMGDVFFTVALFGLDKLITKLMEKRQESQLQRSNLKS